MNEYTVVFQGREYPIDADGWERKSDNITDPKAEERVRFYREVSGARETVVTFYPMSAGIVIIEYGFKSEG